jgi:hypothetical protein
MSQAMKDDAPDDAATDATIVPFHPGLPEDGARTVMGHDGVMRSTLRLLRQEHRDLDAAIEALQAQAGDPFTIKRLKGQKLRLKDRIARIEDELTPDIIA